MRTDFKSVGHNNKSSKKNILIDVLLIVLITSGLIGFNYLLILSQIEGTNAFAKSLFPDQFIVAPVVAFVASIIALVRNRRMVLTISAYLCLGALFLWLRSVDSGELLLQTYKLARNSSYFYLMIYVLFHLTVIGLRRFKKPEYKLITPLGVINWWVLFMSANYLYALVVIGK